jgi:hypothetical protein
MSASGARSQVTNRNNTKVPEHHSACGPARAAIALLVTGYKLGGLLTSVIPCAAALRVITRELWQATAPGGTLISEPGPGPVPPDPTEHTPLAKGS